MGADDSWLLVLMLALPGLAPTADVGIHWQYIIIGAGPAGLQMALHLHQAGRSYIVLERNSVAGSFYLKYPRHRKLISINKRHTGKENKEFNLRHDWNSLLSDDDSLLIRHYSRDYFPDRHDMQRYLHDYATRNNLHIRYDTDVSNITRKFDGISREYIFSMRDQFGARFTCSTLLVATGMWKPHIPHYEGIEYTEGYEDMSINPADFEGKSVLVLGHGNSAFETADALYPHANLVHVAGRSRIRLAWETHYVGDLRSVNNGLLDTYQLKSLDGVVEGHFSAIQFMRQSDNRTQVTISYHSMDNFALREAYDKVIRCLGFTWDASIFTNSTRPKVGEGKLAKYPVIGEDFQVENIPGMFVIGTAAHSIDYRKSAGGFVHGFRYNVRALHRILEWRHHRVAWPSKTLHVTDLLSTIIKRINEASGIYQMFGFLSDVVILHNEKNQVVYLEDVPVSQLPDLFNATGHAPGPIIVILMQYGQDYSGPGKDVFRETRATGFAHEAHRSNFLHPVFYYYKKLPLQSQMGIPSPGMLLPRPDRLHHIVEDFLTTWRSPYSHILPLRYFLQYATGTLLRNFVASECFEIALMVHESPVSCQHYFLSQRPLLDETLQHLLSLTVVEASS